MNQTSLMAIRIRIPDQPPTLDESVPLAALTMDDQPWASFDILATGRRKRPFRARMWQHVDDEDGTPCPPRIRWTRDCHSFTEAIAGIHEALSDFAGESAAESGYPLGMSHRDLSPLPDWAKR